MLVSHLDGCALQSRMQSHAAYPGEKDDFNPRADPDDVAAEAAAELRASQPQGSSMRPRSASEAPRGRCGAGAAPPSSAATCGGGIAKV